MIIRPATSAKCFYCEQTAVFAVSQKSTFYPTNLCQKHRDSIVFPARVIYTQPFRRRDHRPITNVRFISFFKQIAVMTEDGLKHLGHTGNRRCQYTIVPDERNAAEFFLENPPINADGKLYRILKGRDWKKEVPRKNPKILKLSNSLQSWSVRTKSVEDVYKILTKSKKQYIRFAGGNCIEIY